MAEKACVKRLQKEFRALCKEPVSNIVARPSPNNILEWYYVFEGSEGTPFAGGFYYGRITFPAEYPFKPPSIRMTTPNGRFMTDTKICLSMSDFHPESWNPMWSVSRCFGLIENNLFVITDKGSVHPTSNSRQGGSHSLALGILTGLLSFMMDKSPTTGSVSTTVEEKQHLAKASLAFNCKIPSFRKLFPEYVEKYNQQRAEQAQSRVSSVLAQDESSSLKSETSDNNRQETLNKAEDDRRNNRRQSIPTWMILLLFSVFGLVMSLPFLEH